MGAARQSRRASMMRRVCRIVNSNGFQLESSRSEREDPVAISEEARRRSFTTGSNVIFFSLFVKFASPRRCVKFRFRQTQKKCGISQSKSSMPFSVMTTSNDFMSLKKAGLSLPILLLSARRIFFRARDIAFFLISAS
jgi:hypothetical protein